MVLVLAHGRHCSPSKKGNRIEVVQNLCIGPLETYIVGIENGKYFSEYQFEIVVINSEKEYVIVKYCEINIEQYTQENLDSMRNIVMEFEQEFDALLMK